MADTALVLVGLQEARRDKSHEFYLHGSDIIIDGTIDLIAVARNNGYKIIFLNHYEHQWPFSIDESTSKIFREIEIQDTDVIIWASKISWFYQTELDKHLSGIKNIVVAGIPTNLSVRMFVEEAYDREFNLVLIEDLCLTYDEKLQDFTIDDLADTRPDLDIVRLNDFLR